MTFLPASLVKRTNDYVAAQPADRNPRFKRGVGLSVAGGILRYSTITPAAPQAK